MPKRNANRRARAKAAAAVVADGPSGGRSGILPSTAAPLVKRSALPPDAGQTVQRFERRCKQVKESIQCNEALMAPVSLPLKLQYVAQLLQEDAV
jgi:hypothetical protein